MHESNAILNARLDALEYQRNWALTEWARARADFAIASATIAEQDNQIAEMSARIAQLEQQIAKPEGEGHGGDR